jgi:hypothetical protein
MTSSVSFLPVWKANATPAERLYELAQVAEKHPEDFQKFVIVYVEDRKTSKSHVTYTRFHCFNTSTFEALGILENGKLKLFEDTNR